MGKCDCRNELLPIQLSNESSIAKNTSLALVFFYMIKILLGHYWNYDNKTTYCQFFDDLRKYFV